MTPATSPFPYISLPNAQASLMSRMPKFAQILALSMMSWSSSSPAYLTDMDQTARAKIVNCFWYSHCRRGFSGDPGIEFSTLNGQRYIKVDDTLLLRFKLVTKKHLSRNFPTKQSLYWNAQLPLDIPDLARLELAYYPDETWTKIERAYVLYRLHNKIVWMWQIWGAKDDVYEYAHVPRGTDMLGRLRFAYNDFSI